MTNLFTKLLLLLMKNAKTWIIVGHLFQYLSLKNPISVRVGKHLLFARRFDRLTALVMWKFGLLEKQETKLMRSLIRPGMKVVDIGANVGYYALQFAEWVGSNGRVYTFEPEYENFSMLCLAVKKAGTTNPNMRLASMLIWGMFRRSGAFPGAGFSGSGRRGADLGGGVGDGAL